MPKNPRLYSLFEKINGKWIRLSPFALFKASAVHVFQSKMISMSLYEGRHPGLRVVKGEDFSIGRAN